MTGPGEGRQPGSDKLFWPHPVRVGSLVVEGGWDGSVKGIGSGPDGGPPTGSTDRRISTRVRSGTVGFSDPRWTTGRGIGSAGAERTGPAVAEAGAWWAPASVSLSGSSDAGLSQLLVWPEADCCLAAAVLSDSSYCGREKVKLPSALRSQSRKVFRNADQVTV